MARIPRNNITTSFFHIMVQGINKESIFKNNYNMKKYLQMMEEEKLNLNLVFISYCMMPNHAHFLINAEDISEISKLMQKVNTKYGIYYNKSCNRVGYVFRDRYKCQPIKSKEHFYQCVEYIHNNPVKANICKKQSDYQFSSYTKIYKSNRIEMYKFLEKILNQSYLFEENINEKFEFIEEIEDDNNQDILCENLIREFLEKNNLSKSDICIKTNRKYLKNLIQLLKNANNISYRTIEKSIKISRETLRILNKG